MAQNCLQIHKIDFSEIFSLIVRRKLLQIFLAILYMVDLIVDKVDIIGAYLKNLLTDNNLPMFIKLPIGMKSLKSIRARLMPCLLQSIYSFRQFGRLWNQKINVFFTSLKFRAINADLSIFIWYKKKTKSLWLAFTWTTSWLQQNIKNYLISSNKS